MEFTTKRLDTEKNKHFWATDTSLNVTLGFTLNSNEANNAILKKVIENYEHDFQISPEGHYVVVLDRKIETSIGIENDFFSGGTFLIGATVREVQKTKKIKK
ncbi:MAG: hypothetical protein EOO44_17325 [Flavobacterium sp.]|nr:MAG: hypothetical protein EOO44_17325 [Flavobacterium sp.]